MSSKIVLLKDIKSSFQIGARGKGPSSRVLEGIKLGLSDDTSLLFSQQNQQAQEHH